MTLDELNKLKKEATEDLSITEQNALEKTLEVPQLFQRYLSLFLRESLILKKMRVNLDKLYGQRFRYYREDYGRELRAGEIEHFINSEEEYHKKNLEYQTQEAICKYLEDTTQKMKNLSFDLKNFIDLRSFLGGSW